MLFFSKYFWRVLPLAALFYLYQGSKAQVKFFLAASGDIGALWDTYRDIQAVAGVTAMYFSGTQKLPPPREFDQFLFTMRKPKPGRTTPVWADMWGTAYRLIDDGETYRIVSCGPDKDCEKEDDNLVETNKKVMKKDRGLPPSLNGAKPPGPPALGALDLPSAEELQKQVDPKVDM